MNQTGPANNDSDEIDLKDFFKWLGRGFNRVGNSILYAVASIRNLFFDNKLFFAGIIISGLALGIMYANLLKKEYYKSTMVISCDYLNTQIIQNAIEKLNLLAGEPEGAGYMTVLKVEKETAINIRGFEYKPFVADEDVLEMEVLKTQLNNLAADKKDLVEKVIKKLEIENKNAYEITVLVYNPAVVKPLEKRLIEYFSNSDYIRKRIEINRSNLENRKAKLVRETQKLDSLKRLLFDNYATSAKQPSRGTNNVILGSGEKTVDALDVFKQDLDLNRELLDLDKRLFLNSDFEVIDGFTSFSRPDSASLFKILSIAFIVSLLMGYVIIFAWKFDRVLSKIDTKSKD
jgi:hypothetical protein